MATKYILCGLTALVLTAALPAHGAAAAAGAEKPLSIHGSTATPGDPGPPTKPQCCRELANGVAVPTQSKGSSSWLLVSLGVGFLAGAGLVLWLGRTDIPKAEK
ncbi:MAG TPA: hypothetical protein VH575_35160 [Gemmataceae bacterium]